MVTEHFKGCGKLETIVIPESTYDIGTRVFSGCNRLKKIKIPAAITNAKNEQLYAGRYNTKGFLYGLPEDCKNLDVIVVSGQAMKPQYFASWLDRKFPKKKTSGKTVVRKSPEYYRGESYYDIAEKYGYDDDAIESSPEYWQ